MSIYLCDILQFNTINVIFVNVKDSNQFHSLGDGWLPKVGTDDPVSLVFDLLSPKSTGFVDTMSTTTTS